MDGTILIADDDRTIRTVLTQAFSRAGCKVHATASLETLAGWVREGRGNLVVSDVVMPDGNGLEMLPEIARMRPGLPVIVISAQNTIMTAIRATEAEAWDYLPKPFDLPDLMQRAARALASRPPRPQPRPSGAPPAALPLIGRSAPMQDIYRVIARTLNTDLPVLITGPSGTGKSLIARILHENSHRSGAPLVVASAGWPEAGGDLRALFARAAGGTLVFDEITDLDATTQSRLARILDDPGEGAPRLVSTSQGDLARAVEEGRLRADLYYRIATVAIDLPPLCQRVADIGELVAHFLTRAQEAGEAKKTLDDAAMELLRAYPWPGNVREVENVVRRLVVICPDRTITAAETRAALNHVEMSPTTATTAKSQSLSGAVAAHLQRYFDLHQGQLPPAGIYARVLAEIEVPLIEIALDATGGNQAKCAALLGINRNTLRKKITDHDISVTRRRKMM